MSKVLANQNKQEAFLYGYSSNLNIKINRFLETKAMLNYTYGRIKTDSLNTPLDHIPPLSMRLGLQYVNQKFMGAFELNYNGWKRLKNYYLSGEDNAQYATPLGMPAWLVANLRFSYTLKKQVSLQAGVENILDTQYRVFASGINAPGRNIYVAVRFSN
jgi:hemoglobin/transferrin/lactoferrin receptor protein